MEKDQIWIRRFFDYVEIQTKVASVLPFAYGLLFGLWRNGTFLWQKTLWMGISLVCFDMATTAINNHLDAYHQEEEVERRRQIRYGFSDKEGLGIILLLLAVAVGFGGMLALYSDWLVWLLGIASFAVGVCYTAGPIPLSRTPLGEIFSGVFMGLVIPFLAVYINEPQGYILRSNWDGWVLSGSLDLWEAGGFLLVTLPFILCIAGVMLANNICDVARDTALGRHTLVEYIGVPKGLALWTWLYPVAFLAVLLSVGGGFLPGWSLLTCFAIPLVRRNKRRFEEKQDKAVTFADSVQNLIAVGTLSLVGLAMALLLAGRSLPWR